MIAKLKNAYNLLKLYMHAGRTAVACARDVHEALRPGAHKLGFEITVRPYIVGGEK